MTVKSGLFLINIIFYLSGCFTSYLAIWRVSSVVKSLKKYDEVNTERLITHLFHGDQLS